MFRVDARLRGRRETMAGFATQKECRAMMNKLLVAVDQQNYSAPTQATVKQYLTKEWLPAVKATIRPSTYRLRREDRPRDQRRRLFLHRQGGVRVEEDLAAHDPPARPAPHPRHPRSAGRRPPQGRLRTPGTRHRLDYARHFRAAWSLDVHGHAFDATIARPTVTAKMG
jgi:hypothetical protein